MSAPPADALLRTLRQIWRRALPRRLRYRLTRHLSGNASRLILASAGTAKRPLARIVPGPLVVSGFFDEASGVARAGAMTADALELSGLAPLRHDLRKLLESPAEHAALPGPVGGCWLIHANAPEAIAAMTKLGAEAFRDRYRIGYWAWELPVAPEMWVSATRLFDEVWAPSQYVADALTGAHCPVVVMPHPVAQRVGFEPTLHATTFTVLTVADMRSTAARKNPLGAVHAFQTAFPKVTEGVRLIVKILAADDDPQAVLALNPDGRPDITIIDTALTDQEMDKLVASCDAFLSLHRAEGFGLGMAEAMAAGRPVVATGWSGNLQFMDEQSAALVSYTLVPITADIEVYGAFNGLWAEPNLSEAAAWLVRLHHDPKLRVDLGQAGRKRIDGLQEAWSPSNLARRGLKRFLTSATDIDI